MLHHNNAPAHTSLLVNDCLVKHKMTVIPQKSYSPDLALVDFSLFLRLKSIAVGCQFQRGQTEENLLWGRCASLQNALQNWKKLWKQCTDSGGEVVSLSINVLKIKCGFFLGRPRTYRQICFCVRFEVFTAVTMKNGVFWVVTPCGSCKNRRFGGTWRLLHQGDKNR
jgi:hypothetical protein